MYTIRSTYTTDATIALKSLLCHSRLSLNCVLPPHMITITLLLARRRRNCRCGCRWCNQLVSVACLADVITATGPVSGLSLFDAASLSLVAVSGCSAQFNETVVRVVRRDCTAVAQCSSSTRPLVHLLPNLGTRRLKPMNRFRCHKWSTRQRRETVDFGGHEVKGQGHTRPKIDMEAV